MKNWEKKFLRHDFLHDIVETVEPIGIKMPLNVVNFQISYVIFSIIAMMIVEAEMCYVEHHSM